MELRHLKYFVAVAEELNFRRAAERVYVAQGAFSEQVRKLEAELGVRLLDRSPRGVSLTSAGAALLPEARRVLRQAEVARLATSNARDRATTQLRIGYVPSSLPTSTLRALQRLASAMPVLDPRLEPGDTRELVEGVRAGSLDAAVIPLPGPTAGLRLTPLSTERVVAALPLSHGHATKSETRLSQLAPDRIVLLPREANRSLYDGILAAFHAADLSPALVELPDADLDRALLSVACARTIALLPACVAERHCVPGIRFVPLSDEQPAFATAVITSRDTEHMPTVAFLRAVTRAEEAHAPATVPGAPRRADAAAAGSGTR
jgi:DNA-binding transcriptional LysR family regulator